jgi:hypothetical protein
MRSWYIVDRNSDESGANMDVARKRIIAPHVRRRNQAISFQPVVLLAAIYLLKIQFFI